MALYFLEKHTTKDSIAEAAPNTTNCRKLRSLSTCRLSATRKWLVNCLQEAAYIKRYLIKTCFYRKTAQVSYIFDPYFLGRPQKCKLRSLWPLITHLLKLQEIWNAMKKIHLSIWIDNQKSAKNYCWKDKDTLNLSVQNCWVVKPSASSQKSTQSKCFH